MTWRTGRQGTATQLDGKPCAPRAVGTSVDRHDPDGLSGAVDSTGEEEPSLCLNGEGCGRRLGPGRLADRNLPGLGRHLRNANSARKFNTVDDQPDRATDTGHLRRGHRLDRPPDDVRQSQVGPAASRFVIADRSAASASASSEPVGNNPPARGQPFTTPAGTPDESSAA